MRARLRIVILVLSVLLAVGWGVPEPILHTPETTREMGNVLFLRGDFAGSYEVCRGLLDSSGADYPLLYNCGVLKLSLGDSADAESYFFRAYNLPEHNYKAAVELGVLVCADGKLKEGIRLLREAYKEAPDIPETGVRYSRWLFTAGDTLEALDIAAETVATNPASAIARISLVELDAAAGLWEEALRQVDAGMEHFPRSKLIAAGYRIAVTHGREERAREYAAAYFQVYPRGRLIPRQGGAGDTIAVSECNSDGSEKTWLPTAEQYIYKGSWGPIRLGTLTITVDKPLQAGERFLVPVTYRIESNPLLAFISIDDTYRAFLCPSLNRTARYEMKVRETWWNYDRVSDMDLDSMVLVQRAVEGDGLYKYSSQELPGRMLDGTSLLFHARTLVRRRRSERIPTLIDYDFAWTDVEFTGRRTTMKILGEKTEAWEILGRADYTGVAGLSGDFTGWFSADAEALPLKAAFKIFIGSIKLKLVGRHHLTESQG